MEKEMLRRKLITMIARKMRENELKGGPVIVDIIGTYCAKAVNALLKDHDEYFHWS